MQVSPGRSADRTDRPRFRQDLFAELIDEHGTKFIDVMDPDSGNVFRFYEVEYSLACGMDGERDVAGIVKWAQDELGLTPSQQEVRSVIATLGDLGFIDGATAPAARPPEPAADLGAPELASNIVVASPPKAAPVADVELGSAGTTAPPKAAPARPAPSLELGAPGAGSAASRRPAEAGDDLGLGAPGARTPGRPAAPAARPEPRRELQIADSDDVSLDLSDHVPVRPDDVKEAVRASRVMPVVEAPPDFAEPSRAKPATARIEPERLDRLDRLDRIERTERTEKPTKPAATRIEPERPRADLPFSRPAAAEAAPPETITSVRPQRAPEPTRPPEPLRAPEPIRAPEPLRPPEAARAARPPVELPRPPVPASPVEQEVEQTVQHASPLPVVLMIIAIAVAAALVLWKFVFSHDTSQLPVAIPPPVHAVAPPPPAPTAPPANAPAPTSKIALETPSPAEIRTLRAGVIETILGDKTAVKEGDVVVKFVGDKPIEAERNALLRDQKRIQDQIDAATKKLTNAQNANNKSAEAAAQTELANKQTALATKQGLYASKTTELEKFLINAPGTGSFAPQVKQGQKVPVDTVIGTLQRDSIPAATFKVADTKPFALQSSVELTGKDGTRINCTVADLQGDSVKVTCPGDSGLTEGADVTLKVPGAPSEAPPAAGSSN